MSCFGYREDISPPPTSVSSFRAKIKSPNGIFFKDSCLQWWARKTEPLSLDYMIPGQRINPQPVLLHCCQQTHILRATCLRTSGFGSLAPAGKADELSRDTLSPRLILLKSSAGNSDVGIMELSLWAVFEQSVSSDCWEREYENLEGAGCPMAPSVCCGDHVFNEWNIPSSLSA